jgi:phosphoesterase RecJ-like protein
MPVLQNDPRSDVKASVQETNRGSIAALIELIGGCESFLVTSHARPDGDAIGSALGMMHLLEAMGKQVTVAFADPIPAVYGWLPGVERIQMDLPSGPVDAAVLLECSNVLRSGFNPGGFARMGAGVTVNIDHHLSGRPFADFNWIDAGACAVGAMVYDLAVATGVTITPAMATCWYTAVLTDTGSFAYTSTSASTFELAAHLVACGADPGGIAREIYFSNPASKLRALGSALGHLTIEKGIAWAWISQEEMVSAGAGVEDCEGIVAYLIGIAEVDVAIFLREVKVAEDAAHGAVPEFRLSLRSKGDFDVAEVAERFGGGGHRHASGCSLEGPLEAAITQVLAAF